MVIIVPVGKVCCIIHALLFIKLFTYTNVYVNNT